MKLRWVSWEQQACLRSTRVTSLTTEAHDLRQAATTFIDQLMSARCQQLLQNSVFSSCSWRGPYNMTSPPPFDVVTALALLADEKLFRCGKASEQYILHKLPPPKTAHRHYLRRRNHNFGLTKKTSSLTESNYLFHWSNGVLLLITLHLFTYDACSHQDSSY